MTTATGEFSIAALSRGDIRTWQGTAVQRKQASQMLTADQPLSFELEFTGGERVRVILLDSGREPAALWRVLTTIKHLSSLPSGWDSYGAQPLTAGAVRRGLSLLPLLFDEDTPEPSVIPTRDGGLQFEWHQRGIDVEVIVRAGDPVVYYVADATTDQELERTGNAGRVAAQAALARLSRHVA